MRRLAIFVLTIGAMSTAHAQPAPPALPGSTPQRSAKSEEELEKAHKQIHAEQKVLWDKPELPVELTPLDKAKDWLKANKFPMPKGEGVFLECEDFNSEASHTLFVSKIGDTPIKTEEDYAAWLKTIKLDDIYEFKGKKFVSESKSNKKPHRWTDGSGRAIVGAPINEAILATEHRVDPVDKFTRITVKNQFALAPLQLYVHRGAGAKTSRLMMQLLFSGDAYRDVEKFKVAVSGRTFEFATNDITRRGGEIPTAEALFDITDNHEFIRALLTMGTSAEKPSIIRFHAGKDFYDREIEGHSQAVTRYLLWMFYVARYGR